jgi:predicted type IV restriction endonuclease
MLNASKKQKLLLNLKAFQKQYFTKTLEDLDESGTRLLVNELLTNVLGYQTIEEIKTEYMIRGTYADYVIQTKGIRHFLIEVKALSFELSDKHLRQAINYGANEGIDYALLTNGKDFQLYKILFNKPIESKLVFKIDLSDRTTTKESAEWLQHIHRDAVVVKSLDLLWKRFTALDATTIAGLLFNTKVTNFLKRELKTKYKSKFDEKEVKDALMNLICIPVDLEKIRIKSTSSKKGKTKSNILQLNEAKQGDEPIIPTP